MNDTVIHGDALEVLRGMADNSVDAIVTDPPAGINFMNKPFDDDRGGRDQWVAWLKEIMIEAKRVLKPGGHALIWALPRTSHWTATALEDAGFEVRDKLYHLFGSGFPKSTAIDKQIDKMLGAEREVIGQKIRLGDKKPYAHNPTPGNEWNERYGLKTWRDPETKPATPEAQRWQGYGTALKPSCEEWVLVRKPLAESSIAAQVLATGTGGLAIDACRVEGVASKPFGIRKNPPVQNAYGTYAHHNGHGYDASDYEPHPQGRFPSHLLLSHSLWCVPRGTKRVLSNRWGKDKPSTNTPKDALYYNGITIEGARSYSDPEGMETVEAYDCAPDCPIAELDRQSGVRKSGGGVKHKAGTSIGMLQGEDAYHFKYDGETCKPSTGFASRYFQHFPPDDYTPFLYQSKASRAERNAGCEDLPLGEQIPSVGRRKCINCDAWEWRPGQPELRQCSCETPQWELVTSKAAHTNSHPTVKPLALMRWLIRLITPPDGIVLDPFCGSGSTLVACVLAHKHFIGIEQDASYVAICEARIAHAQREQGVTVQAQEYDCAPDCPVRILGEQSGVSKSPDKPVRQGGHHRHDVGLHGASRNGLGTGYGDQGTAARYFQQFPPDSLWCDKQEEVPA